MNQTTTINGHRPQSPNFALTHAAEAQDILAELRRAGAQLEAAIQHEAAVYRQHQEMAKSLQEAEAELIYAAVMEAKAKSGPLAGIATTSKAYELALKKLVTDAHRTTLKTLADEVHVLRASLDNAKSEQRQREAHYNTCKHAALLKGRILELYAQA